MPDISVIIPIYNVRNFIGRCAESLMKQTLNDVEFIFVDDCTPDDSIKVLMSVLEKYPDRKDSVRIVRHEVNKGLPSARNTGLELATGEYIFHCDGDDFVEPEMLAEMYRFAAENNLDIVWSDFYEDYKNTSTYVRQPDLHTADDAVKAMMNAEMRFNVWNKIVRNRLYSDNGIRFLDGHQMGEDLTMMKLFPNATGVGHIDGAWYHYVRYNPLAMTKALSQRGIDDINANVLSLLEHLPEGKFENEILTMKLWQKFPLVLTDGKNGEYRIWHDWFPEANKYIRQHKNTNFRLKAVEWCTANKLYFIVRLHYQLVLSFIYKMKYD